MNGFLHAPMVYVPLHPAAAASPGLVLQLGEFGVSTALGGAAAATVRYDVNLAGFKVVLVPHCSGAADAALPFLPHPRDTSQLLLAPRACLFSAQLALQEAGGGSAGSGSSGALPDFSHVALSADIPQLTARVSREDVLAVQGLARSLADCAAAVGLRMQRAEAGMAAAAGAAPLHASAHATRHLSLGLAGTPLLPTTALPLLRPTGAGAGKALSLVLCRVRDAEALARAVQGGGARGRRAAGGGGSGEGSPSATAPTSALILTARCMLGGVDVEVSAQVGAPLLRLVAIGLAGSVREEGGHADGKASLRSLRVMDELGEGGGNKTADMLTLPAGDEVEMVGLAVAAAGEEGAADGCNALSLSISLQCAPRSAEAAQELVALSAAPEALFHAALARSLPTQPLRSFTWTLHIAPLAVELREATLLAVHDAFFPLGSSLGSAAPSEPPSPSLPPQSPSSLRRARCLSRDGFEECAHAAACEAVQQALVAGPEGGLSLPLLSRDLAPTMSSAGEVHLQGVRLTLCAQAPVLRMRLQGARVGLQNWGLVDHKVMQAGDVVRRALAPLYLERAAAREGGGGGQRCWQ